MILCYVTCRDEEEAKKIISNLLNKKLIACANFLPIKSIYRWNGEICYDNEIALILKTTQEKFNDIKEEIKRMHSYEIPCVLQIEVKDGNEDFLNWVSGEIKS